MADSGPLRKLGILIYNSYLQNKSSWISLSASFDGEPCFPHGIYGIFISGGSTVGHNCVIFQQVTIGSNTLADSQRIGAPRLGDNCYIGSGAKLIGKIKVGSNVRIGANAVVYKDVPDNCIVVSGNQENIPRENLNNKFYHQYNNKWVYFKDGNWVDTEEKEFVLFNKSFLRNTPN